MDLSTVRNRDRLKPQREPYWHKIDARQYLGFRPSTVGGPGSWIARWYDPETRRNRYNALGEFGDLTPSDRYGAALKAAREWLEHVGAGGSTKPVTVKVSHRLLPDTDLIELFCAEAESDLAHMPGK